MKRIVSALSAAMLAATMLPAALAENSSSYIAAPYSIGEGQSISDKILDPVFYDNGEGEPTIGVTLVGVIAQDGKFFRDADNDQELDVFEDWRLDTETRAADLVTKMTLKQQAGLFFNNGFMGPANTDSKDAVDESGAPVWEKVWPGETQFGSSVTIEDLVDNELRASVLRSDPDASVAAWYNNMLEQVTEYDTVTNGDVAIPFTIVTNPIACGYPGTLGITAAVMGDVANGGDYSLVYNYADHDRQIMSAKGIDQIYGPQIDLVTDPRWSRNSGTYAERVDVNVEIVKALVTGYQSGTDGVQDGDVSLNMKHFPGDGAAQNGFESHNKIGEWRVYATENSLDTYQLPGFKAAIEANVAGIMPGYTRPSDDARTAKQVVSGVEFTPAELVNALSKDMTTTLLRDILGFKGYVNADSGVIGQGKSYGSEDVSETERLAMMIQAGVDCIADTFNPDGIIEAIETGLLDKSDLDRATANRLYTIISLGNLDNPYVEREATVKLCDELGATIAQEAYEANQKSVVLMKNTDAALPMTDVSKKVYVQKFGNGGSGMGASVSSSEEGMKAELSARGFTIVEDYAEADVALLTVYPTLTNTKCIAVLDLGEDFEVEEYDTTTGLKTGSMTDITTVEDMSKLQKIAEAVHANGGKVIGDINISSPWILTALEPYCDALLGTFSTSDAAVADVLAGVYAPTGKLPITMVSCDAVIAVSAQEIDGEVFDICVSPNDVPGYEKDQYIAADVLAQSPSGSYAYKDADGNDYWAGFGLSY